MLGHFLKKTYFSYLAVLFAGALLPLAFSPVGAWWLAWFVPVVLFIYLNDNNNSVKKSFLLSYLFGVGFFAVGISWIFVSIHDFGGQNIFIATLLTMLLILAMALYFGAFGIAYFYLKTKNNLQLNALLLFPVLWLLFEWLRSILFSGFPWLLIGFSQTQGPLNGFIPLCGEYGVGYLLLFCSGVFALMLKTIIFPTKMKVKNHIFHMVWPLAVFFILLFTGMYFDHQNWTKPNGRSLTVAMVQGNIPQAIKWSPDYLNTILQRYADLTSQVRFAQMVIWPEGAIPLPSDQAKMLLQQIDAQAKQNHSTLLTGIPVNVPGSFDNYYNAFIALGDSNGVYYKRYLVPFGEYVPWQKFFGDVFQLLNIPMSSFIPGPMNQPNLQVQGNFLATFICYEIAFDQAVLNQLPKANVLVTVSDDAWFGDSFAPAQHLQIGQFRAMQTGRWLLFASNNGITALVSPQGDIIQSLKPFTASTLSATVAMYQGSTPWIIMGNWPIILILLLVILIRFVFVLRLKK